MIRLYQPASLKPGQDITLDKNPSHHLIRVLRAKKNSEVILFNGDGHEYLAELVDDNQKHCQLHIKKTEEIHNESSLNITLLQGISRGDRMDTCIQKSTELGVNTVIPVICQRTGTSLNSKRAEKKMHHWHQIAISACEQSGRCIIPQIQPVVNFTQVIGNINADQKIILTPTAKNTISKIPAPVNSLCILIGPEGGFTQEEVQLAVENNFTSISLGPRILRTETAGPACITSAQILWGDLR